MKRLESLVALADSTVFAFAVAAITTACASEDPEVGRRGGPAPVASADPDLGGASAGASGAGGAADGGTGLPIPFCDALVVVEAKCQRCHGQPLQNGAPAPLLTLEDFHRPFGTSQFQWWERAKRAVERGFMPYVALNEAPFSVMPPVEPLTADEKDTLLAWLEQGALPEGGTDCPLKN